MKSKGALVLWWEARPYPTRLLLTKGIEAQHPHTSKAAAFHTAVLRDRETWLHLNISPVVSGNAFRFLDIMPTCVRPYTALCNPFPQRFPETYIFLPVTRRSTSS